MAKEKTLFVLGAGASNPYGFPLASQLRKYIIDELIRTIQNYFKGVNDSSRNYNQKVSSLYEANELRKTFDLSNTQSIDLFLNRNQERFLNIGKLAIILSILDFEKRSKLREDCENPQHNWYLYLFNKMTQMSIRSEDFSRILDNNFSFLTFNYDRSLEHYFYGSLLNSFSQESRESVIGVFNQIPIKHVYGEILDEIPYGHIINYASVNNLKLILDNIITPFEYTPNDEIQKEINSADRIFFLGFAYHKENMDVLNIGNSIKDDCRIYCCCYGLSKIEIEEVEDTYFSGLTVEFGEPEEKMDSVRFLKHYLDFKEEEMKMGFID